MGTNFLFLLFLIFRKETSLALNRTSICPHTRNEWIQRSNDFACATEDEVQFYHYIRTQENVLIEVCARRFIIFSPQNGCPFYNTLSRKVERKLQPCTTLKHRCPSGKDPPFYTDTLYQYPACIERLSKERSEESDENTTQSHPFTETMIKASLSDTTAYSRSSNQVDTTNGSSSLTASRNYPKVTKQSSFGNQTGMYIPTYAIGIIGSLFLLVIIAFPITIYMCLRKRTKYGRAYNFGSLQRESTYVEIIENDLQLAQTETISSGDISYVEPVSHTETFEYSYAYQYAISKIGTKAKLELEDVIAKYDLSTGLTMTYTLDQKYESLKQYGENKTGEQNGFYQRLATLDIDHSTKDAILGQAGTFVAEEGNRGKSTKRWNSL